MDYIRWMIFEKYSDFFDTGAFIPAGFFNLVILFLVTVLFWPVGVLLIVLSAAFWGTIIFVFLQRYWQGVYREYKLSKNGPGGGMVDAADSKSATDEV